MQSFLSSKIWGAPRLSAARSTAASAAAASAGQQPTVLVTGAGGKTGKLIAQKLQASPDYTLRALVRTEESKQKLAAELQLGEDQVVVTDVAVGGPALQAAMQGCSALIVATSATPKLIWASMPAFFWNRFVRKEKVMPQFTYPQMPEQVDYEGQVAQFDAAKAAGVGRVVLVSSMGGTQAENTLNKIGAGNILVWKRKAEQHLIASGLAYTIVHPGGLKDEEGGRRQLVLDVDDELLKRKVRNIARADVAELCVQSLSIAEAKNRSIDVITEPEGEGTPTTQRSQFQALFAQMTANCDYSVVNPVFNPK